MPPPDATARPPVKVRTGFLVALALAGLLGTEMVVGHWEETLRTDQREAVFLQAAQSRAMLESEINANVHLARGLVAFVRAMDPLNEEVLRPALRAIYEASAHSRNVGLAPGNELSFIYPLQGNEAALGLRYADVPEQWPSVERAMRIGQTVLAGPVRLAQGGYALINRTPVFLEDGAYWGMISMVINLDSVLDAAELTELAEKLRIGIAGDNASERVDWIFGDRGIDRGQALSMPIRVPGATWTLYAMPLEGWARFEVRLWLLRIALDAGFLALLVFVYVSRRGQRRMRLLSAQLQVANDELAASNEALEYLSRYDGLTNVANRRYFDQTLRRQAGICQRNGLLLTVMMIDLDHFKQINDNWGHAVGDACLVRVAALMTACLQRDEDFLARYGGEEFALLLVGLDAQRAESFAERLRGAVAGTLLEVPDSPRETVRPTVSIGLSCRVPLASEDPTRLCDEADEALYAAKKAGRNCVKSFQSLVAG